MSALTLEEKSTCAALRAREQVAEKHFYDAVQPHYPLGFSVIHRNAGHWDVIATACPGQRAAHNSVHPTGFTSVKDGDRERAFRIRGAPGNVAVYDERWNPHRPHPREAMTFRTVSAAMLWIAEELMQEPA